MCSKENFVISYLTRRVEHSNKERVRDIEEQEAAKNSRREGNEVERETN